MLCCCQGTIFSWFPRVKHKSQKPNLLMSVFNVLLLWLPTHQISLSATWAVQSHSAHSSFAVHLDSAICHYHYPLLDSAGLLRFTCLTASNPMSDWRLVHEFRRLSFFFSKSLQSYVYQKKISAEILANYLFRLLQGGRQMQQYENIPVNKGGSRGTSFCFSIWCQWLNWTLLTFCQTLIFYHWIIFYGGWNLTQLSWGRVWVHLVHTISLSQDKCRAKQIVTLTFIRTVKWTIIFNPECFRSLGEG